MAYDEGLAEEVRERLLVAAEGELTEKRMFGGLGFMVGGKLTVAASRNGGRPPPPLPAAAPPSPPPPPTPTRSWPWKASNRWRTAGERCPAGSSSPPTCC